jgi:hypothetical protein
LLVLLAVRRWMKSAFAMPFAILSMAAASAVVLRSLGMSGSEHGWYLPILWARLPPGPPSSRARTGRQLTNDVADES